MVNMRPADPARHYAEAAAKMLHPENIAHAERAGTIHLQLFQAQTNALTAIALVLAREPAPSVREVQL